MLHNANGQSADDVDQHDQNTGDGIAAHEFTGAIHGAIKLGFLSHFSATSACFVFANQSGI